MKLKRAGMVTKLLLLALLVVSLTTFLNLRSQAQDLEQQRVTLEEANERQRQENEALSAAIAEKDDPARIEEVARKRLGLVAPGEIVFYDNGN